MQLHSVYSVSNFRALRGFNTVAQRAVEHGLMKSFSQKTERLMGIKPKSNTETTFNKLTLQDFFYLIVLGNLCVIVSLIVFIMELLRKKTYILYAQ